MYFQYLKGKTTQLQSLGSIYWWLDYNDGLVRRGLVGQLFQFVFGELSPTQLARPVWSLHVLGIFALAAVAVVLSAVAFSRARGGERLTFGAVALWIFASQLWATLTFNVGYLDGHVLLLALTAAMFLARGWTLPCAAIMVAGPFVHEYFLFLVPFILAAGWNTPLTPAGVTPPRPWTVAALGALAFAAAAVLMLFSKAAAGQAQVATMPVDAQMKQAVLGTVLGQGFGPTLKRMMFLLFEDVGFTAVNFAFYLAPAVILSLGIVWWRAPRRSITPWVQAAAGLFPVAALLIAWDLSRLLVMTTFTSGMLFLLLAVKRSAAVAVEPASAARDRTIGVLSGVSIAAALIYAALPMGYVYFENAPVFFYPQNSLGRAMRQTEPAGWYELAWSGMTPAPGFTGGDITCRMTPSSASPGCVRTLQPGVFVYGPDKPVPMGSYRASVALDIPAGCTQPVQFDVISPDFGVILAEARLEQAAAGRAHLDFQVGRRLARRAILEVRVWQEAGPPCAVLETVTLEQRAR